VTSHVIDKLVAGGKIETNDRVMLEINDFGIFKESYRAVWKDQIDINAVKKLTYACSA